MVTKAERDLLDIIDNKSERIKKLKLECGRLSTQVCVLNLRIKELEADRILKHVLELREEIKDLKAKLSKT